MTFRDKRGLTAQQKLKQKLTPAGWALRWSGAVAIHDNGDGIGIVFRWWHPLSWLMWVILLPVCGIVGEKISDVVQFRVSKHFQKNPDRLHWL